MAGANGRCDRPTVRESPCRPPVAAPRRRRCGPTSGRFAAPSLGAECGFDPASRTLSLASIHFSFSALFGRSARSARCWRVCPRLAAPMLGSAHAGDQNPGCLDWDVDRTDCPQSARRALVELLPVDPCFSVAGSSWTKGEGGDRESRGAGVAVRRGRAESGPVQPPSFRKTRWVNSGDRGSGQSPPCRPFRAHAERQERCANNPGRATRSRTPPRRGTGRPRSGLRGRRSARRRGR